MIFLSHFRYALRGYPLIEVGNFFETAYFEPLSFFYNMNKICGFQHTLMCSSIKPGKASIQYFHMEFPLFQIIFIHTGDFLLSASAWLYILCYLNYIIGIYIESCDSKRRLRYCRFFYDSDNSIMGIKFYDTISLWISHFVRKHDRFSFILSSLNTCFEHMTESLPIKDIISQYQTDIILADKIFPNCKGLSKPIRISLYRIRNHNSPLTTISEKSLKTLLIIQSRDHQNISNSSQHQDRKRIIYHRLIIDRHQLLGNRERNRMKPCTEAPGKDNSFHINESNNILLCEKYLQKKILTVTN